MIFGDGTFFDAMRRGLKTLRETGKQIADPIIELRQMANRITQPEASTGMFKGGMVVPYGPISMPLRPQYNYGPVDRPDAPSFSKGGVVKGKAKKKASKAKKAPKKK
jgi:hypothetical protein